MSCVIDSYKMIAYKLSDKNDFETFLASIPRDYQGAIFKEKEKDTIGNSGGNPTWFSVYRFVAGEAKDRRVAIYKEFDYDEPMAAYAEKLWSILGKSVLKPTCRVPDIDVVYTEDPSLPETVSYRVLDNEKEDLVHMSIILDSKYENEGKHNRDFCTIEELLAAVRSYVKDDENYKELEENIIHTILLDSISNNADRNLNNWGIVRNKQTNRYELALFDHSIAFVNLIMARAGLGNQMWAMSYLTTNENYRNTKFFIGDDGYKLIKYIGKKYPEFFETFMKQMKSGLPEFIKQTQNSDKLKGEIKFISQILESRTKNLQNYKEMGEIDDD